MLVCVCGPALRLRLRLHPSHKRTTQAQAVVALLNLPALLLPFSPLALL